jgi:ferric-dicitrate binding protein FerR (iron transport regulator)
MVLHRIHHNIRLNENKNSAAIGFWHTFQRIAAILIIPLLLAFLGYFYFPHESEKLKDAYAEIECPMGARIKFHLPDGTVGYLNSGSRLRYPVRFIQERNVELIGEAYFEVAHNKHMPFHVNTKNLDIMDVGTNFDVIANEDEKTEEVILQSGEVDISSKNGERLAVLKPNEQLTLNTEKRFFTKNSVDASQYSSWKDGKLVFRNENMQQVASRLSRWYNAEVLVADPKLDNYTFHATFTDEPLDEVLKLLSMTTPLNYTEGKRSSDENGVYEKRKIVLKINHSKVNQFK